eukprot:TRINITY_DN1555_c0_g2_i6.p1 TRINITY_DN1555_c0_g2~~TRINITY_DN1555_c0_g2_i6.p1  ORF type:complete len:467 (-),score=40.91 TRINITY_DN1555_c0_g2_i6:348-1748(-)
MMFAVFLCAHVWNLLGHGALATRASTDGVDDNPLFVHFGKSKMGGVAVKMAFAAYHDMASEALYHVRKKLHIENLVEVIPIDENAVREHNLLEGTNYSSVWDYAFDPEYMNLPEEQNGVPLRKLVKELGLKKANGVELASREFKYHRLLFDMFRRWYHAHSMHFIGRVHIFGIDSYMVTMIALARRPLSLSRVLDMLSANGYFRVHMQCSFRSGMNSTINDRWSVRAWIIVVKIPDWGRGNESVGPSNDVAESKQASIWNDVPKYYEDRKEAHDVARKTTMPTRTDIKKALTRKTKTPSELVKTPDRIRVNEGVGPTNGVAESEQASLWRDIPKYYEKRKDAHDIARKTTMPTRMEIDRTETPSERMKTQDRIRVDESVGPIDDVAESEEASLWRDIPKYYEKRKDAHDIARKTTMPTRMEIDRTETPSERMKTQDRIRVDESVGPIDDVAESEEASVLREEKGCP